MKSLDKKFQFKTHTCALAATKLATAIGYIAQSMFLPHAEHSSADQPQSVKKKRKHCNPLDYITILC